MIPPATQRGSIFLGFIKAVVIPVSLCLCGGFLFASGFEKAKPGYAWKFPNDHGAHPTYRTEWWYYTGFLTDGIGGSYGFQLTFFRTGLKAAPETRSSFEPTSIYFAHFAVSDLTQKTFDYAEKAGRPGPGLAGAA